MKTLLFYNGDWHKQKPVRYQECFEMSIQEIMSVFYSGNYRKNTGTFLMTDCLAKILDADRVSANDFETLGESDVKAIVTNALHCISPRYVFAKDYWQTILDKGKKVVPMTFGLRYHENGTIYLTDEMVDILCQIAERNEIGVRGEYVAEVLNDYGIKNLRLVGCHSLFYHMNRMFRVRRRGQLRRINFHLNQCYQDFFQNHRDFCNTSGKLFHYIFRHYEAQRFEINYTMQTAFLKELTGFRDFTDYNRTKQFMIEKGRYFFSVEDWIREVAKDDFSIGTQFHGTVASLLAGTPALLITIDNRAEELARYHKIPYIKIEDFDAEKPLEYYYELADCSTFNRHFSCTYDNFLEYCRKNDVPLKNI